MANLVSKFVSFSRSVFFHSKSNEADHGIELSGHSTQPKLFSPCRKCEILAGIIAVSASARQDPTGGG